MATNCGETLPSSKVSLLRQQTLLPDHLMMASRYDTQCCTDFIQTGC